MKNNVDLHVHSTASDGSKSPTELVALATEQKLAAFALTDHDTIAGIMEAVEAAADADLEILPGVELSCDYNGTEIHMLGFGIDIHNTVLCEHLTTFQTRRDNRNQEIVRLLAEEGFDITYEKLLAENPDSVITRGNISRYLVEHGCVPDTQTVFAKYLGDNCKCNVPRLKIAPEAAIELIHQAGGIAFLAHPILYHMSDSVLDEFVASLAASGLDGIEAVYSTYQPVEERQIKSLAAKYQLMMSGGSDYHGKSKPKIQLGTGMGHLYVPYDFYAAIKEKLHLS